MEEKKHLLEDTVPAWIDPKNAQSQDSVPRYRPLPPDIQLEPDHLKGTLRRRPNLKLESFLVPKAAPYVFFRSPKDFAASILHAEEPPDHHLLHTNDCPIDDRFHYSLPR